MYFMEWAEETKGLRKVILSAVVVLMPVSAWAMDCSKARTNTEKAICSSPELKKQDDQMNRDYRNFINHYSKSGLHDCYIEDQKREQKDWVKKRDACGGDIGCIAFEYQDRLLLLSTLANACPGYDSDPAFKDRKCYEPSLPTAPVASTASPTAPTASGTSTATQQCSDTITSVPEDVVKDAYPEAEPQQIIQWSDDLNAALNNPKVSDQLNSKYKMAFYLAQTSVESNSGKSVVESLVYQVQTLEKQSQNKFYFKRNSGEAFEYGKATKRFIKFLQKSPGEANKYGLKVPISDEMVEKMIHPANEEAIGNRLYANKNGNGDIVSGDGYKYRGRGLIQVTGKSNYHNIANKIKEFYGENLDLLEHPDVVSDRPVESAISYWASRSVPKVVVDNHKPKKVYFSGLGALVDYGLEKGMTVEQINKDVTRAINGGYNALWERKNKLDKLLKMTFFKLCKEVEKGVKKVSLVWLVNFIKSV